MLQTVECLICKRVPIKPHECAHCEVIFCRGCIDKHRQLTIGRNSRKCPQCLQEIEIPKPLNRNILKILQKLRFKHSCCDYETGESCSEHPDDSSSSSELAVRVLKKQKVKAAAEPETAFEAFKRTPQYKAILLA